MIVKLLGAGLLFVAAGTLFGAGMAVLMTYIDRHSMWVPVLALLAALLMAAGMPVGAVCMFKLLGVHWQ